MWLYVVDQMLYTSKYDMHSSGAMDAHTVGHLVTCTLAVGCTSHQQYYVADSGGMM
jgi:hypothetical protein